MNFEQCHNLYKDEKKRITEGEHRNAGALLARLSIDPETLPKANLDLFVRETEKLAEESARWCALVSFGDSRGLSAEVIGSVLSLGNDFRATYEKLASLQ